MAIAMAESDGSSRDLLFEVREGIGYVGFNRPETRNALTFAMYERLAEICAAAGRDDGPDVLVISGAGGRAFAAGTDISQFREFRTTDDALDYEKRMDDVLGAVERCRVPTIAAIAGACTGGGAAIATACDLRLATRELKFGFPIARTLGNCLSTANLDRLSALIGAGRTRHLIFTACLMGAEEALTAGLVSEVVDDYPALQARASDLAKRIRGF